MPSRAVRKWLSPAAVALASLVVVAAGPSSAQTSIGQVKSISGAVFVDRAGTAMPVRLGDHLQEADRLRAGADGTVGITFIDNSMMSLGPESTLSLDRFRFDSTTHAGAFDSSLRRGTLSVKSGQIVRQTPEAMTVRTPASILGVRGTEFVVRVDAPADAN